MYYFAYGLNLDRQQMKERCPKSQPKFSAKLHHYKLVFSGWSRQWHGGTASIKPIRGERLHGAIYQVSESDIARLDSYEGFPTTYDRINIIVNTEIGDAVQAFTYIRKQQTEETKPS
ncbi:MAG: gamma-glutamylcyclotransferase, partial [Anaerolineales bacterium]|nr:gamma-glutamylcyclotransferase [Anaerolineales bacterium]